MFEYNGPESGPYLKRVPTRIDKVRGIQTFDKDNLYPQRAIEILKRAYTLKTAVQRLTDFTIGNGFVNKALAEIVVNNSGIGGTTLLDLHRSLAYEFSWSDGIPIHVGYNMLGEIISLTPIRFEYVRMGLPDEDNQVQDYKYSVNWEGDRSKSGQRRVWIDCYPKFNPDPEVVLEQIDAAGGILNYTGQMIYLTPMIDEYPTATFDAVMDHAQAQSDSAEFTVGITQNAFLGNTALVYPGEFESEEERIKFKKYIEGKKGARNAGAMIGIQTKNPDFDVKKMFQSLDMPNSDKMFEYTDKNIKDAQRENYSMPREVMGQSPETGMFNQTNIREAYNFFNSITETRREVFSKLYQKIFSYWTDPVDDEFKIQPKQYISNVYDKTLSDVVLAQQESIANGYTTVQSAVTVLEKIYNISTEDAMVMIGQPKAVVGASSGPVPSDPGVPPAVATPGSPVPSSPAAAINPILTRLSRREKSLVEGILNDYKKGRTGPALTRIALSSGYGFTPEQIEELLQEYAPDPETMQTVKAQQLSLFDK